jgi:hypothetical protein
MNFSNFIRTPQQGMIFKRLAEDLLSKRAFLGFFCENWVYKFGHRCPFGSCVPYLYLLLSMSKCPNKKKLTSLSLTSKKQHAVQKVYTVPYMFAEEYR